MSDKQDSEKEKPKCHYCAAVDGDKSKIDGAPLRVRLFHGRLMCSDCEDALVYSLEH